jgi:hypothetical protein
MAWLLLGAGVPVYGVDVAEAELGAGNRCGTQLDV